MTCLINLGNLISPDREDTRECSSPYVTLACYSLTVRQKTTAQRYTLSLPCVNPPAPGEVRSSHSVSVSRLVEEGTKIELLLRSRERAVQRRTQMLRSDFLE